MLVISFILSSTFLYAQLKLTGPGAQYIPNNQDGVHVLYEQIEPDAGGIASQDFEPAYNVYDCQGADDFVVPAGVTWDIQSITAPGSHSTSSTFTSANVLFYNDVGGVPNATEFVSFMGVFVIDNSGTLDITLPGGLTLTGGTYWVSVQIADPFAVYGQWYWTRNLIIYNTIAHWRNPGDGFGTGATTWTPVDIAVGHNTDFAFTLYGESFVEIGTGTSYGSYPMYYTAWANYWENCRTQTLYLASEIGGAMEFTELGWNFQRVAYPDNWLVNVSIKFIETSLSSLPSGSYFDMTGATQVYSNPYYIPATSTGWNKLDIDDYVYNGTQNIVVEILWGDNDYYEYPYYRTYVTTGSGTRTLYGYSDYETPPNYDGSSNQFHNIRFFFKPATPPGDLEGYVFNGAGLTIAGATVGIDGVGSTTTDPTGYYFLGPIPNGDQEVTAWKAGYNVTTDIVFIPPGGLAYHDFILTQPTMFISPTFHSYTLNPNEYYSTQTGILNMGDGPLDWEAEIVYPATDYPKYEPGNSTQIIYGEVSDPLALNRREANDEVISMGNRDVGDVISSFVAPLSLPWGIGHDGDNLWLTDPLAAPTTIYEVTTLGALTGNTISAPFGGSWIGDMASDGTFLYCCNVGGDNAIKVIDLATGTLVSTITGAWTVTSQRGLGYDADNDEFYIGGWNSDMIWRTDGSGATISTHSFNGVSGLEWHPQGGPDAEGSLWVVENSSADIITEIDPNNAWVVLQSFGLPGGGGYGGAGAALDPNGTLWVPNQNTTTVYNVDLGEPMS
jgi:hypothetical protein